MKAHSEAANTRKAWQQIIVTSSSFVLFIAKSRTQLLNAIEGILHMEDERKKKINVLTIMHLQFKEKSEQNIYCV
ncbi:CLUMA_CG014937, isoform A [Clunio marinus]|uniref:CLUMA_CG014937, isoform A n=1 Tax=Clunio marinus TaxID=568069 RepID=A0A1J1IT87_9DIPT|nr:CLUMA_CG014937, isoform A [Clunio marinus]